MSEKSFRQRVIRAIAGTQKEAGDALGVHQHSISAWIHREPKPGSIGELLELAMNTLTDEELRASLRVALAARSAGVTHGQ